MTEKAIAVRPDRPGGASASPSDPPGGASAMAASSDRLGGASVSPSGRAPSSRPDRSPGSATSQPPGLPRAASAAIDVAPAATDVAPAAPDAGPTSPRPWAALDPALGDVLGPCTGEIAAEAVSLITVEHPTLVGDLVGAFGRALRLGIDEALQRFVALLGTDDPALDHDVEGLYRSFGGREDRHGRSLDALLAAYRLGARTSWRHFSAAGVAAGLEPGQLSLLAEAVFVYIDELSAASALGFAHAQAERSGRRDVARARLAEALLAGDAATAPARVHQLAAEADWVLPERLAVAVITRGRGAGRVRRLGRVDVLVVDADGDTIAIIPGPPPQPWGGRRRTTRVGRALVPLLGDGDAAFVGTLRAPGEAATSLAHARVLQELVPHAVTPDGPVTSAVDHLAELVLHADEQLFADLRSRVLAPLADLTPARREALVETLAAWFTHLGDRARVADALEVHPQTVSYRITQLRGLLGDVLDDPERRFALWLAVHGHDHPSVSGPSNIPAREGDSQGAAVSARRP